MIYASIGSLKNRQRLKIVGPINALNQSVCVTSEGVRGEQGMTGSGWHYGVNVIAHTSQHVFCMCSDIKSSSSNIASVMY